METQREQEFVVAKVSVNGVVDIEGNLYSPSNERGEYQGEFNGDVLVFSLYRDKLGRLLDFCALWGFENPEMELSLDNRILMAQFLWWNEI